MLKVLHPKTKVHSAGTSWCPRGVSGASLWLQEGAEGVVHGGQVQVLRLAAVGLYPWLSFLFVLFALIGQCPPPADGALGATLQTCQDHLGEILLEPLEVLSETAQTRVRRCPGSQRSSPKGQQTQSLSVVVSILGFDFQLQKYIYWNTNHENDDHNVVVNADVSQQGGCGFDPGALLCVVCMFFFCLRGFCSFLPHSKNMENW